MIEDRTQLLIGTISKLLHRGARQNVQKILAKTHAADIASVLQGFEINDRFEVFKMVSSVERRAEILSYLELDMQIELLAPMSRAEVLNLVEKMDTDDAADLLGKLPHEESVEILKSMEREDSAEVADLMGYPEDTAGGLMSSDYLALNENLTVEEAIRAIQELEDEGRISFYIYVVNEHQSLVGVLSLKQLLLSRKMQRLKDLMTPEVISVNLDTHQEEVAKVVERYDFLSIPVIDSNNELKGVITVDDILDVIREEAQVDILAMGQAGQGVGASTLEHFRARLPWLFLAFVGGCLCFTIVYLFAFIESDHPVAAKLWLTSAFIPLLLSMSGTVGSQTATVIIGLIRSGRYDFRLVLQQLKKEIYLGLAFAFLFSGIVYLIGVQVLGERSLSGIMAFVMATQIVLSMLIGSLVPHLMHKLKWDPTATSVPLFTTVADLTAVAVLFGYLRIA